MRGPDAKSKSTGAVLEIGGRLANRPSDQLIATAFADELANQRRLSDAVGLADIAHTLMMMSARGPIPKAQGAKLLGALLKLQKIPADFQPDPAQGDIYTNREAWLAARCGATGWLGVSRARREAVTCGFHIIVRKQLLSLVVALSGFSKTLIDVARKHRTTLFPDYTYLQAAQPTTLAHYLLGFAGPIERHTERALELFTRFNLSPAGGGSANGSIAPQNRTALARLMGFDAPVANTRDAMWQADLAIEAGALIANILITLDRLGEDLMAFATQEFGLIQLSDAHSRASKIMPQKKNPFALSYVRALANQAIGTQATIAASMRTPSGQMDNRMTAYAAIPTALDQADAATRLMSELVEGMSIDKVRAKEILANGELAASDLAERLMLSSELDFRQAHKIVGTLVRTLRSEGRSLSQATPQDIERAAREAVGARLKPAPKIIAQALDPRAAVEARTCHGGAAPKRVDEAIKALNSAAANQRRRATKAAAKLDRAEENLLARARAAAARR